MIHIVSERSPFDTKKLKKPKELKGVRPIFSLKWGGVTSCQVFVKDKDVWINHHDWCSHTFYGANIKYKQHFVYNDGFTAPTVKGDAWIVMRGVVDMKPTEVLRGITYETEILDGSRFCRDDSRMFEDVVVRLHNLGVL